MAFRETGLNILIRARDLSKRVLERFRKELKDTDDAAEETADGGLRKLTRQATAAVGAFFGFREISRVLRDVFATGDRFEGLALQLQAVMGSLEEGEQAVEWIREFTRNTPLQLEQVTEAFVTLKNFGLDPQAGTLQAIVDQNELLGGGYERLIGIVRAYGQANAKQKLQGEEILQLIERGVPVWQLLADATGRTTAELNEMSRRGELTTDVIQQLIEAMGRNATGAAERNMGRLSGIISNLRDVWTGFLDRVAQSGALDALRVRLQELQLEVTNLTNAGDLDRFARRLSEGIVAIVDATGNAVRFVVRFSGELTLLAKAFVAVKAVTFAGNMVRAGAAMLGAAGNAKILTSSVSAATAAIGRLQLAISGLGAFIVGWQIGTYLRERFLVVEKLSNTLVGNLLLGWERLRFGWEAVQAVFTDDTIEAANARYQQRTEQILESMQILQSEAGGAAQRLRDLGKAADDSQEDVAELFDLTLDATEQAAAAASAAQEAVTAAFDTLDGDLQRATTGISTAGREAIDAFNQVRAQIEATGQSSEEQAAVIVAAFQAAFEQVETDLGRRELLAGLRTALDEGIVSYDQYQRAINDTTASLEDNARASDAAAESTANLRDTADQASESVQRVGQVAEEASEGGSGAFAILSNAINGYLAQMDELGARARTRFTELVTSVQQSYEPIDELDAQLLQIEQRLDDLRATSLRTFDATGLQGALNDMGVAAAQTTKEFLIQQRALRDLESGYESGAISAERYIQRARSMLDFSNLLNDQDLSNLRSGIEAAERQMASLRDEARNTLSSLQDELDRLEGNTAAVQAREQERRLADLEQQLDLARRSNDEQAVSELQESLRIAERIFQIEQQRAREADQRQQQNRVQETSTPAAAATPSVARQERRTTVDIRFGGQIFGSVSGLDDDQTDDLVRALERINLNTAA